MHFEDKNVADILHQAKADDNTTHNAVAAPHIETEAWNKGSVSLADSTPRAVPGEFPPAAGLISPAEKNFDAHTEAGKINEALHVPFFSLRFFPDGDKVFGEMLNMTPAQFKATEADFNKNFAAGDKPYFSGDKTWTLQDDINRQLSSGSADQLSRLMESKSHNDVPLAHRVDGQELLKPDSPLKVGEMNAVTLPNGRRYDVYIPKNADNRAPVMVAMHGAAGGDSVGLMATESGLTADAERTGQTVVFAYPEARKFAVGYLSVPGVAWNAPGRENLPTVPDRTDDIKYMDNVLKDLGAKTQTSKQVGMFGFSDGGRFAQVYAAERPEKVSAVVSEDGTWMKKDAVPTVGKPIMIVHGTADQTLPYSGGMGSVSRKMDGLLGTNLQDSAPSMQASVWKAADQCDGPFRAETRGEVTRRDYMGCKVGEVKEFILQGGEHGINDYKNNGSHIMQWLLGSPDRRQDFSTQGAEFLRQWTTADLSTERPR